MKSNHIAREHLHWTVDNEEDFFFLKEHHIELLSMKFFARLEALKGYT